MSSLDIVVPSVRPVDRIVDPLDALRVAVEAAGIDPQQVTLVDDRQPLDSGHRCLAGELGFRYACTPGMVGPGPARNLGAVGTSSWILFVDDDVILDPGSLQYLIGRITYDGEEKVVAVMGGLRLPPDVPQWFRWADEAGLTNPASAAAGSGVVPLGNLCSSLIAVRRVVFESVGGFPSTRTWEDFLLGHRIAVRYPHARLERDLGLSGVHLNVPDDWDEWLERQRSAGARLAAVAAEARPGEHRHLVSALHLDRGIRAIAKRGMARLPDVLWRHAFGRHWRRLAASATFARGFLKDNRRAAAERGRLAEPD